MPRRTRLAAFAAASLTLAVLADAVAARFMYSGTPSFVIEARSATAPQDHDIATLVFPAILSDAVIANQPLAPFLQSTGDVVYVQYDRHRQDLQLVARAAYDWLWSHGYRRVTVIGQSLGGDEDIELAAYNARQPSEHQLQLRLILHDAPAGRPTLVQRMLSYGADLLHPGPAANQLTSLFWHFAAQPHRPSQLESDVDPHSIAVADAVQTSYPLSGYASQVRTVGHYRLPWGQALALRQLPVVLLVSDGKGSGGPPDSDGVVRHSAADIWQKLLAVPPQRRLTVHATHVDCVGSPHACHAAYADAFEQLGPWR